MCITGIQEKETTMTTNEINAIYEATQKLMKYMNGKELGTACEHCPYCDEDNDEQEECLSCACYEISLLNYIKH